MKSRSRRPSSGYTLLEVLIALALLSVLVAIIGGLMSVFARAEATAQRTAVELRTLRSVRRQLTYDLERLVIAAEEQEETLASTAVDTEQWLDDEASLGRSRSSSSRGRSSLEEASSGLAGSDRNGSVSPALSRTNSIDSTSGSSENTKSETFFVGTPLGFRCRVMLSSDPAVWLQSLVEPPGLEASSADAVMQWDGVPPGNRTGRKVTGASGQRRLSSHSLTPDTALFQPQEASIASLLAGRLSEIPVMTSGELEYRLAADREFPGMGRRLERRLTTQPVTIGAISMGDPNAVLGIDALYREDLGSSVDAFENSTSSIPIPRDEASTLEMELDFQASSVSTSSASAEPMVAERLRNASFRYSDGMNWYRVWDAAKRGGLPVAIELTFDLERSGFESSEAGSGTRRSTAASGLQGERIDSDSSSANSADLEEEELDPFVMEQESLEFTDEPDREVTPRETDVRWVIGIVGAEPSSSAIEADGSAPARRSTGGMNRGGTRGLGGER